MNNRIRKVTVLTGVITTFAGTGTASYSGDSGQASSAELNGSSGVAIDSAGSGSSCFFLIHSVFTPFSHLGNMYIADTFNNRVRKVTVSTPNSSPRYLLLVIELVTHLLTYSLILPASSRVHHPLLLPFPGTKPLTINPSYLL